MFLIFGTLRLFMMTTNLFVIANVKQMRTGDSFRILLPLFFQTSWSVGVLNSAIFNSFHNRVEFGTILEGLRNFGGRGLNPSNPFPRYATVYNWLISFVLVKCFVPSLTDRHCAALQHNIKAPSCNHCLQWKSNYR